MDAQSWFFGDTNMLTLLFGHINEPAAYRAMALVNKQCAAMAQRVRADKERLFIVPFEYNSDNHRVSYRVLRPRLRVLHGQFDMQITYETMRIDISAQYWRGRLNGKYVTTCYLLHPRRRAELSWTSELTFVNGTTHGPFVYSGSICIKSEYKYGLLMPYAGLKNLPVMAIPLPFNCIGCGNQTIIMHKQPDPYCVACNNRRRSGG